MHIVNQLYTSTLSEKKLRYTKINSLVYFHLSIYNHLSSNKLMSVWYLV